MNTMTGRIRGFKILLCLSVNLFCVSAARCAVVEQVGDEAVLAPAYLRSLLVQQVSEQAQTLIAKAPADYQAQISESVKNWSAKTQARVRTDLQNQFGDAARTRFERFIATYTDCESRGDTAFLSRLTAESGLSPTPTNYVSFRRGATGTWLKSDIQSASKLLSDLQSWLDLTRSHPADLPPLSVWLQRDQSTTRQPPSRKAPTLADSEAAAPAEVDDGGHSAAGALDSFGSMRKTRRDQAHQQAQAGMQQIAAERETWEQENANQKSTQAQAESENIKKHAEQLAQADKDAIDQYKDSWEMKLKTVASATVGSAVGAFTGTIGSQAGQKAADAIFDTNKGP